MSVPAKAIPDYLEAYESTFRTQGGAQIVDHLPLPDDPLYLPVLVELVRIDLEHCWEQGHAPSLLEYQRQFPKLFTDVAALQAVAEEEFRQRLAHGEQVSASEYQQLYGVLIPDQAEKAGTVTAPPVASSDEILARAYQRFWELDANDSMASASMMNGSVRPRSVESTCVTPAPLAAPSSLRPSALGVAFPEVGQEFMGFRLLHELGRGAFGRVFLAQQGNLANRRVALKIAPRLFDESQTLAQLQHTNIVPIYSFHQVGSFQGLCMPYFGATTLADLLRSVSQQPSIPESGKALVGTLRLRAGSTHTGNDSRLRLPTQSQPPNSPPPAPKNQELLEHLEGLSYVEAVLWIGARLAEGLAHAHQCGIVHRDLKPANVLLTDDGQPMLLDFNLSQDTNLRGQESRIGGTLLYMAPEHLDAFAGKGGEVDARSDLYSLGVILYEMLAGRHPFPAPTSPASLETLLSTVSKERRRLPTNLRRLNRAVSPAVAAIIEHCLQPDPQRRYQSGRDLLEDLERQLTDQPLRHAKEPSLRERAGKWIRRHPRLTACCLVTVAVVALFTPPAGLYAARENRRTQQAFIGRRQFQEELRDVQFLLNSRTPNQEQLQGGLQRGRTALNHYGVLDDVSWKSRPEFRYLPSSDQQKLGDEIAELLLLLARGQALTAATDDSEPVREALRLNHLAEQASASGFSRFGWLQRAQLADRLHRPEEATEARQQADKAELKTAQDHYLLASQYLGERRFSEAVPLLQEATRLDPKHFGAWFNLGVCHVELGEQRPAADCFSAALSLEQNTAEVYFQRGLVYEKLHRYEKALADFEEAVRLRPGEIGYLISRALVKGNLGRHDEAIADLSALLQHEGAPTRLYFLRAAERQQAGDKEGAEKDRQEGLKHVPTDEFSWTARGFARLGINDRGALADFDEALKINPRFFAALQNKASVLSENLHREEDALAILNREIELYPDYVTARLGRGVLLARLGRRDAALQDAEYSLQHDRSAPTFYQAANIFALTSRQKPADAARAFPLLLTALVLGFGDDFVDTDADFDPIREQPLFKTIIQTARSLRSASYPSKR